MKKRIAWLVVLALIAAGFFGYSRFMRGELKIDRELVSDENLNLLADNWEKLVESQNLLTGREAEIAEDGTISWTAVDEKSLAFFTVIPDAEESDAPVEISATYRSGILEWLKGFETAPRFGEKSYKIFVSNPRLEIIYLEPDSTAVSCAFDTWFADLLKTARS